MADRDVSGIGVTLLKLFLVGIVVLALFRLAFFIGGVLLGGVTAVVGVGFGLVLVVGTLVVVFSLLIAPFVLVGWLASKGWAFLKSERL